MRTPTLVMVDVEKYLQNATRRTPHTAPHQTSARDARVRACVRACVLTACVLAHGVHS